MLPRVPLHCRSFILLALFCCSGLAGAADKSGVSANAISLPAGPGSIEGLGESFEPSLNNGTARYGLSLHLPPGTAGHAPAVRFSYDGGQGNGPLGFGWSLPLPFVQRQTDKGIPRYVDAPNGRDDDRDGQTDEADELDIFINDAKEELVPLANGDYFCENEGSFVRYRRVGDHWEGALPNGTKMQFGQTDAGRVYDSSTNHVFQWLLERQTDTHGNTILYSWQSFPGSTNRHQKFLKEIRYGPGAPPWTHFHFVVFHYEDRPDWFEDCRAGFVVRTGKRLKEALIGTQGVTPAGHASSDFNGDGQVDALNRKYRLTYLDYAPGQSHWSLLHEVTQVGADGSSTLPPARFGYAVCHPPSSLSASSHFISGTNEPPAAMDNPNVELIDLNGDALPDLLRTGAAGGAHIAYLNRGEQTNQVIAWSGAQSIHSADGLAWNVNLQSATDIAQLSDMNGDGLADLAYKSALGDVFFFANLANQGTLGWGNRQPMTPQDSQPPAVFGNANARAADLDFDKRIDVIESLSSGGGADYRIWFNLGNQRYARSLTVPQTAGFLFSLAGVHVADFNGDRVPDILRLQPTTLTVTAGLGHGQFAPPMTVALPDWTLDSQQLAKARLEDITGDGLNDLVIERAAPGQIWYWINKGNYTLDGRRMITGLPAGLGVNTRWADLNANGTTDLVFADSTATPRILTVDLGRVVGCVPTPNTLTRIENGIGGVTTIEYASSTRFALEDAADGHAWTNRLPFPITVVARVLAGDSLGHTYETRFRYHDGYYDPIEKEFRGFSRVEKIDVGDATAPTLVTRSHFDTGRDFESMKGKRLRLTTEQEDGLAFWDEVTRWTPAPIILHSGTNGQTVKFVHPTGTMKAVSELGQGIGHHLEAEFEYDSFGNVTREANYGVVEPGQREVLNDERVVTTQYVYNLQDWLVRLPWRKEVADEQGVVISRTEIYYDDPAFAGANPGTATRGDATLERAWVTPSDPGAFINRSRTVYDGYGNPTMLLDPLAAASGGTPDLAQGHVRELAYDAAFRSYVTHETVHLGQGKTPLVMQAEWDPAFGTVSSSFDCNEQRTRFQYDAFARLTALIKPGDAADYPTEEYEYFPALTVPAGVVSCIETRKLDRPPGSAGSKRAHYHLGRRFVDGLGRELMVKREAEPDPDSGQPRVAVSGAAQFNARQRPGRVLNAYFSRRPGGTLDELLGYEHLETPGWTGTFQSGGQSVALALAQAHATRTEYDATGRARTVTQPDGRIRTTEYEPLLARSRDENDTEASSPFHNTPLASAFDGLGRQIRTDEIVRLSDSGESVGESQTWSTHFEYNLNDKLTRVTDAQGNVKTVAYDGLGRVISMNDPDRGRVQHWYDAASNRTNTLDAKNQTTTTSYDGANRILTEDYQDATTAEYSYGRSPDVLYHYDTPAGTVAFGDGGQGVATNTRGRLAHVEDASGEEHTSFDARGRVAYVVKRVRDPWHQALVPFRTAFDYDSLDRITSVTYPDNDQVHYEYGNRTLLQRVFSDTAGTLVGQFEYLPSDQTGQMRYGNGVQTRFEFDQRMRVKSLVTTPAAAADPFVAFQYGMDGVSNLQSIEDLRPATVLPAGHPRRDSRAFDYDDLYRLKRAQFSFHAPGQTPRNDGEIHYRYDRIGNLISQHSGLAHEEDGESLTDLGTLSYGGDLGAHGRQGRDTSEPGPHALSSASSSARQKHLTYDANGNVRTCPPFTYTWDFRDRLVTVESSNTLARYTYDYTGRRIIKETRGKSLGTPATKPSITIYPGSHFEVREHEAPVKYVWQGTMRVARVSGSLSSRPRVQRLRLQAGWNLVGLAVEAEDFLGQINDGSAVVEAAYRWDVETRGYAPVQPGETVAPGSVLWLKSIQAATLSVRGQHVEPPPAAIPEGGGYVAASQFEPLALEDALPSLVGAWRFDAFDGAWQTKLPEGLEASHALPPIVACGEALYMDSPQSLALNLSATARRIQYYHQDHLGSTIAMTDAEGNLLQTTAYYPFGAIRQSQHPARGADPYAYSQKEQDSESGLLNFEARYLAGKFGRFLSPDPLYSDLGTLPSDKLQRLLANPQKLGVYSYALNNPLKYIDPTGLDETCAEEAGVCESPLESSEAQYYAENPLAFYQQEEKPAPAQKSPAAPTYLIPATLDAAAAALEDAEHALHHVKGADAKMAVQMAKQGAVVLGTAAGVVEAGLGAYGVYKSAKEGSTGGVALYGTQTVAGGATTYGALGGYFGWAGAAAAGKVGLVLGTGLASYKFTTFILESVAPIHGPSGSRSEDVDEAAIDEFIRKNNLPYSTGIYRQQYGDTFVKRENYVTSFRERPVD